MIEKKVEGMEGQLDSGSVSEIDLESGGKTDEDVEESNPILSDISPKKYMQRSWSKLLGRDLPDGSVRLHRSCSLSRVSSSEETFFENDKWQSTLREVNADVPERKMPNEKHKNLESTRHPKPPRPPGGPPLDDADTRFAKEVSELAILKRKRAQRMKALQKLRKEKTPSSSISSIFAAVVTMIFFLVIIFQGFLGTWS